MRLIEKCPICNKNLELLNSVTFGTEKINSFKCGHFFTDEVVYTNEESLDFRCADQTLDFVARDYQKKGVEFIIESGFSCIIGDQMRLGKTPQFLLALKNRLEERIPCLGLVRAANIWQWHREFKTWTDTTPLGVYVIQGGQSFIPPGFKFYLISMDTFSNQGVCKHCSHSYHEVECKKCKKHNKTCRTFESAPGSCMKDKLLNFGFKCVVADEAHSFKNQNSNRSQALVKFLYDIHQSTIDQEIIFNCMFCKHSWTENVELKVDLRQTETRSNTTHYSNCPNCNARVGQVQQKIETRKRSKCGIVLLTGTAIKNRADEYFVPLNLVAPTLFPSIERFRRRYLMQDSKGNWSRISPYCMDEFKEIIEPYVLRREKEDVYTDLPVLNKIYTIIEPERNALTNEYNSILDKIETKMGSRITANFWDMQDDLMKLRRVCGLMKLPWTADYCEITLTDSDKTRIAVGIHHKDVRDLLKFKLGHIGAISLSGEDSPEKKDYIMTNFANSPERILVINMLAGGVGMDFCYVQNVLILERQWSHADEQQFEFRFYNPDKNLMASRGYPDKSTNIEYILANGTIDVQWHDMVESKRIIEGETIGTNWDFKTQPKLFRELMERTLSSRL